MACMQGRPQMQRTEAARVLLGLITKVSEDEIPLPLLGTGVMFSTRQPTVKNSMVPMRHLVVDLISVRYINILLLISHEVVHALRE